MAWTSTFRGPVDPGHDVSIVRSFLETRQKRLKEDKERREEAAYHSLLMRMQEGFAYHRIIYDEQDRPVSSMIIDVNDAFEQVFSRRGEPVLGRDVRTLIADTEGFEHEILKAFNGIIKTGPGGPLHRALPAPGPVVLGRALRSRARILRYHPHRPHRREADGGGADHLPARSCP